MVAGYDIAVDPAVVCSGEQVLRGVLRSSSDLDGLIVLMKVDRTCGGEDAGCQGCEGDVCWVALADVEFSSSVEEGSKE